MTPFVGVLQDEAGTRWRVVAVWHDGTERLYVLVNSENDNHHAQMPASVVETWRRLSP